MSSRRHVKKTEEKTDINISPMIDMVFILLIFFIVTTVFVEEEGLDVDKPTPQPPDDQKDDDRDPVMFRLTSTNQVVHEGETVPLGRIELIVRNALAQQTVPVILQVESGALSGLMIQVMDRAKLGGANIISVTQTN